MIVVKFTLKNIIEKKFRTFLIIFSIMISSALFFATGAMTGTMEKIYTEKLRKNFGAAEIMIQPGSDSPSPYFSSAQAENYRNHMEYMIGVMRQAAFYRHKDTETSTVDLQGIDFDEMQMLNPVVLAKESNLYPFSGKKIIISKASAEKYKLNTGDSIEIEINGEKHKFTVCGIAQPTGFFVGEIEVINAVVPRSTLGAICEGRGKVSTLYIKLKDPDEKSLLLEELSKLYSRYTVKETITKADLNEQTKMMTTSFSLTSLVVFLISIFIIYTSFRVIIAERLPIIGTFRSVGATKGMTNMVLLLESAAYGIIGGGGGVIAGIGMLYILTKITTPDYYGKLGAVIEYSPGQLVLSFMIAILLSVVSSLLPIISVSKISVKDIVLNKVERPVKNKKRWKLVVGIAFLAATLIFPPLVSGPAGLLADTLIIILCALGIVFLIPYLTELFIKIFERVYIGVFGNIGTIAAKNMRNNRSILNNISLLGIGISCMLMINSTTYSIVTEMINYFDNNLKYQVSFSMPEVDKSYVNLIKSVPGVTDTSCVYAVSSVEVEGSKISIGEIQGIDKSTYLEYYVMDFEGEPKALLEKLDQGRNIIITNILKNRYNVKIGDTLTLRSGNTKASYKVTGLMNTLTWGGDYAIISDKYFRMDFGSTNHTIIDIKTDPENAKSTADEIKKKFAQEKPTVTLIEDLGKTILSENQRMYSILNAFSFLTMIIGVFGIINNLIISFIDRKRYLAVYRSVGMSKVQIVKMIFIEALSGGTIGGTIGVIGGVLMLKVMPYFIIAIGSPPIPIKYTATLLLGCLFAGIAITLVASISPAIKSSKLNIIESIKYE